MLLLFLQILHQLPLEHLSPCDQLRCLLGLLSLTAYITTCSQEKESRTSPDTKIQNEAGHSQSEARSQNEAVLNSCLQLMMVIIESSGTASVFQLLELQTCLQWLQRLQKLPVGFLLIILNALAWLGVNDCLNICLMGPFCFNNNHFNWLNLTK